MESKGNNSGGGNSNTPWNTEYPSFRGKEEKTAPEPAEDNGAEYRPGNKIEVEGVDGIVPKEENAPEPETTDYDKPREVKLPEAMKGETTLESATGNFFDRWRTRKAAFRNEREKGRAEENAEELGKEKEVTENLREERKNDYIEARQDSENAGAALASANDSLKGVEAAVGDNEKRFRTWPKKHVLANTLEIELDKLAKS